MIKAIAFDLDGTLVDFLHFKKETARAAAHEMVKLGLDASEEEIYEKIFEIYDKKGMEYQKTFADVLSEYDLSLNEFEKIQQAGIVAYLRTKFGMLRPYPDVLPALRKLRKDYKLAVVTDAPRNKAWQRLVMTDLQDSFDLVITVDDTGKEKPHKMPFEKLIKELDLKPEEILFVGDHPEKDIKGAKEMGMKTAFVNYSDFESNSEQDFDIESIKEIKDNI
ncbi:MAG: HAD-IA family hydrolase [Candidatus Undinarchaeales archaeon]